MPKFILSDESVNRYGFRVLTKGIKLDNFKANPVMFYNHDRSQLPIGKWINIEVKGDKLMAEPEFDTNDEFAMKIKDKVDKGIINSTSIGFDVLAMSDEYSLMLPGQKRPTVTECDIFEVSMVDIPGNSNAIRMRGIQLSGDALDQNIGLIIPEIKTPLKMDKIIAALGLKAGATEEEIVAAIEKVKNEQVLALKNDKAVAMLVKMGEAKGLKKETVEKLAKADFDATLEMVEATVSTTAGEGQSQEGGLDQARLSAALADAAKHATPSKEDRKDWTLSKWEKEDSEGLKALIKSKPAEYALMFEKQHGYKLTTADLAELNVF